MEHFNTPGANATCAYGISGNDTVGFYVDACGYDHRFIYEIPETCTLLLLGLGALRNLKRFPRL
jgi:hypothetical protein